MEHHGGDNTPPGYYKELCDAGNCGGVSKMPNPGNDYFITWAADKLMNDDVNYRGYVLTADGRQYKIADLPVKGGSELDFSNPGQNTYLRGRIDNLGGTAPTGLLGNGHFEPQANVVNM